MWNKVIAIVLILVVFVSVMWFVNPFAPANKVLAGTYRSGFLITPEKEDASGVLLDSSFILTSESNITLDYIKENVSIRSGEMFTITPTAENKYIIKTLEPLEQNQVYFFDVNTPLGNTVTFAFQTKRDFTVLGSLPEKMSSYVPLDTGIELYFSYPDVESIAKHFEISPKVDGRFENNGYTSVFIPKGLKAETLYTVTIKKGLTAAKGAVQLAEDYTFSFETSPDQNSSADPYKGNLHISNSWLEFGTTEIPAIGFDVYMRDSLSSVDVNLRLYRFNTLDDFLKAIRKKEETPFWAAYASSKNKIDSSRLEKILELKQSYDLQRWQQKYMMLPEALEHGYYLVELSTDELVDQAFLQVSDITSYSISDKDNSLFWLNDLKTKAPVKGAEIFDYKLGKGFLTDSSGLVEVPTSQKSEDDYMTQELYRVTTTDGKVSLINSGYSYFPYPGYYRNDEYGQINLNWQYIQTDRTLYKTDDTVEFWGYIKSRIDGSSPENITVELARGGYYYPMRSSITGYFFPSLSNALETLTLKTEGGFYEGSIKLPALEPGSYNITIKDGDRLLSNSYISVENYIKPQYKLEITSDRKAVFVDEEITFTVKASFFDGTPVSNVPLNYYITDHSNNNNGQGVTDKNGILTIKHTPKYSSNMQGENYSSINVSATFPETGEIHEYHPYRTFANDITIESTGEIVDDNGVINVKVNNVDLTTLNDDDLENDTILGEPINGQRLNVNLVHITWEKFETGDVYDAINKVVRKTYEYREKRTSVGSAQITTAADGTASHKFSVSQSENGGYYTADITTQDGNNRTMKQNVWIYRTTSDIGYPTDFEYFNLKPDKESYRVGEAVNVQVINNKEVPLENMTTLFIEARNGIQKYKLRDQPKLSMAFPEHYAPNYYLHGIVFNGKTYLQTVATIVYDYNEKKIDLKVSTDKDSYKPGDNMTIHVEAKDANGKPVSGKVNISLVDEALLKLSGQYLDVLPNLYSWIGDGITKSNTNRDAVEGIRLAGGYGGVKVTFTNDMATEEAMPAPSAAPEQPSMAKNAMDAGESVNVRSDFKDTALFKTVSLSEDGLGSYTFKLPDNITSFSLATAAISDDLHAGSDIQSTKVSMPFFINDAPSLDYLAGDKPYVGLTAYGDALEENELVSYELTIKELPNHKQTAEAKAFERVNLPLPTMEQGAYTIIMRAVSQSGKADALSREINVYSSYRTIEMAKLTEVTQGMKFEGGKTGLTTLIFTDAGRASIVNELHNLSWDYGKRLDQKLVTNAARELLKDIIKNDQYYIDPTEVNPIEYKNQDGGYGILPYAGSDIGFTALITPLLKDVMDTASLKMYLYDAVMSEKGVQAAALFALAELGEPVLLDLNRAAQVENLSLVEYVYLGMAYEAIGDVAKATDIYQKRVSPELERLDPYTRVKVKKNDTDASYKQTALVAAFAARLNHPDASKLFSFVANNYSKTEYVGVEKVLYLAEMAQTLSDTEVSFEYTFAGKTYKIDLSDGSSEVVKVPSINLSNLRIPKVTGDVSVLSLFTGSYTDNVKKDTGLTLNRKYYDAATGKEKTTFAADDLIKVVISYTISNSAIDNTYEISDYAPAGLKPLDNPWNYGVRDLMGCWYRQFDGQKVTFVVGKYDKNNPPRPLVYYARVASPGEYVAEGTIAQGSIVKSSIVTTENTIIVIEP